MKSSENTEEIILRKCCFTGYRPSKLPFSTDKSDPRYIQFENDLFEGIANLLKQDCRIFYTGMAMGFDIIAAEAVLLMRRIYHSPIKLICVMPYSEQSSKYPESWKQRYNNILSRCDEKIVLSDHYFDGCFQKRNEYMVKNSDYVLTWYDGQAGGTRNTLNYAARIGRYVFNINRDTTESFAVQTTIEII